MNIQESLAAYAIDPVTGFVPATPPLATLPPAFGPWEQLVPALAALIRSRRIRGLLEDLPLLDTSTLVTTAQLERALLILSVFGNSCVWGGEQPQLRIPSAVAVPLCRVARMLGRPPITHYASMALNNWQLLDPNQPLSADNARMQVQFLGGTDEDWFFIASLGVELAGGPILALVQELSQASQNALDAELVNLLDSLAQRITDVHSALRRMREWCDPHTYYLRVRPFLSGWPAPGVVYEGVDPEPQVYVGGSAGQSSLIQAIDAVLGIDHGDTTAGRYLRLLRGYMPPQHRRYVEDVEQSSQIRARVTSGSPAMKAAYNTALAQVDVFRKLHTALAHDFILKPSGRTSDERGTGGTDLSAFLDSTRLSTSKAKV